MNVAFHRPAESGDEQMRICIELLDRASNRDEIIAIVRTSARRIVGADGVSIVLREDDQCHYVEEDAIGPLWKGQRFPVESCVSGWAMNHRQTVVIPDILFDPRVPQEAYRKTFVRSMAMVPLGDAEPEGAIGAYWAHAYTPSQGEIGALEEIAAAAGTALRSVERRHDRDAAIPPVRTLPPASDQGADTFRRAALRMLPRRILPFWQGQLLAVVLVAASAGLRGVMTPVIGSTSIFTAFFPVILLATLLGGGRSAVTAVILSTVAGASIDLAVGGAGNLGGRTVGWLFFAMTGALTAIVASFARIALDQQRQRSDALEQRDWQLGQLTRELDHRTRNTLAVVMALTGQAARASSNPSEMGATLLGQFDAMSVAQRLLFEQGKGAPSMRALLENCLAPFIEQGRLEVLVDDAIEVPDGSEMMLCLAFNELATNACKYGALSVAEGQVRVTSLIDAGRIRVLWSESGGPKVAAPAGRSNGTRLIEKSLTSASGGNVELRYLPAGAVCSFSWQSTGSAVSGTAAKAWPSRGA